MTKLRKPHINGQAKQTESSGRARVLESEPAVFASAGEADLVVRRFDAVADDNDFMLVA